MKRLQYVRTMENSDSRQESVESQLRVKCLANQTPVVENVCGLSQNSSQRVLILLGYSGERVRVSVGPSFRGPPEPVY